MQQIDLLLSVKIGGMVALLAQSNPEFAQKFNRARIIIDLRNRSNRQAPPPADKELET